MHDPVPQLTENHLRDVRGVLGDEVDSNAFGADQTDDELHLFQENRGGVPEEEVSLIEAEDQPGFLEISNLREVLVEL